MKKSKEKKARIALYARVSKDEEGVQNPENQLKPLRKLSEALRGKIVREYVDYAPGGSANRPEFQELLVDVRNRKLDIILIWSLDRFSREGIRSTLAYLEILKNHNCALKSLQESWLDTGQEGLGDLLVVIFAWIAKQERERISARTKAGLKRAKNVGKRGKDKNPRRRSGYVLRWSKQRGFQK